MTSGRVAVTGRRGLFRGATGLSRGLRRDEPCGRGVRLGIRRGTMAHSWVQSFESEPDAFAAFAQVYEHSTLLIDTYDTEEDHLAAAIEPPVAGVRLDSGDLAVLAAKVRSILDAAGRNDVKIFGSGDLNEFRIAELLAKGPRSMPSGWGPI